MASEAILQYFFDLADESITKRIDAARSLTEDLKMEAPHVKEYVTHRLVKGLPSNRKCARQGFVLALTHLMETFSDIPTKGVYDYCMETNCLNRHVSSKEVRDSYTGYLFCVSALSKAKRLTESPEICSQIFTEILSILNKTKLSIKDLALSVLFEILDKIEDHNLKDVFESFREELKKGWEACTPERLALCFYFEKRQTSLVSKILKKNWNYSHLSHPQNYEKIAGILKTCLCQDMIRPQWSVFVDNFVNSKHKSMKKFVNFFLQPTPDNKTTAIIIKTDLFSKIPDKDIHFLISEQLIKELSENVLATTAIIKEMSAAVEAKLASAEISIVDLMKEMISVFPKTNSCLAKILMNVMPKMPAADQQVLIEHLKDCFITPDMKGTYKELGEFRANCVNWMGILSKQCDDKTLFEFTKMLFVYSFFEVKGVCATIPQIRIPKPALSKLSVDMCKSRFNSSLKTLSTSQVSSGKKKGVADDSRYWVYHLMSTSLTLITDENFELKTEFADQAAWRSLWSVIDEIEAKSVTERTEEDWAFELLFLHAGILHFEESEQTESILADIHSCYEKQKEKDSEDADSWKGVFVDLLILMLSYESNMLRTIACDSFKLISGSLDQTSVQLILDALNEKKDEEGDSDEESDEEDNEEDDDEDDDDEDDDNVESDDDDESISDDDEDLDLSALDGPDVEAEESEDINLSDMDDEQMKEADRTLGLAIKATIEEKKEKEKEKKEAAAKRVKEVHFRVKILDFVDIMIETVGVNEVTITIIPTLLEMLHNSAPIKDPVRDRVIKTFQTLLKVKSEKLNISFHSVLKTEVPRIQQIIMKSHNKDVQNLAVQSMCLVAKAYLNTSEEPATKKPKKSKKSAPVKSKEVEISEMFEVLLENFLSNKNTKLDKKLFFQLIERFPSIRWLLVTNLTASLESESAIFPKLQSLALLSRILSFPDDNLKTHFAQILKSTGAMTAHVLKCETTNPHHLRECLKLCQKMVGAMKKNSFAMKDIDKSVIKALESIPSNEVTLKHADIANLSQKIVTDLSS